MEVNSSYFFGAIAGALIVDLVFSLLIANAAKKKGRSWAAFFWLSFLVSWLIMGIVVAVVQKDPTSHQGAVRNCPYCDEPVSVKAVLCKHCKSELEPMLLGNLPLQVQNRGKALGILGGFSTGVGFLWVATYYFTQGAFPLGSAIEGFNLKDANILIGIGILVLGIVCLVVRIATKALRLIK